MVQQQQLLFVLVLALVFSPITALDKSNFIRLIFSLTSNPPFVGDLLVVSVATNQTDGYQRFIRSLEIYGYKYEVGRID